MKQIIFLPTILAVGFSTPLSAQSAVQVDASPDTERVADAIVVTGTRSNEPLRVDQTGSSITVLDSAALEQRQTREISDILRDVPGVAASRIAGQTQVRLRGTEANQVLVLIDGIEVSDPFAGEFDFGTLAADEAARVEVLRGQQSALYGSDAIGGVIQYITLNGREAPGISGRIEGGSFGTLNGAARVAGLVGEVDYALSGTINTTDGTPNARGGRRDLSNDKGALSGKANWQLAPNARLGAVVRYSRVEGEFNDSDNDPTSPTFGLIVDTPGNRFVNEAIYGLLRGEVDLFEGRWSHAVVAQIADTSRDGYNLSGRSFGNTGQRLKGSYETTAHLGTVRVRHDLTLAVDAEREHFRNTDPSGFAFTGRRRTDNLGIVGQYTLAISEAAGFGAAVRRDVNSRFADTTTYRLQGSYRFDSGTRLKAAVGSGVKNPGYYELFGFIDGRFIGNADLKPEKSEGWEAGVEQEFGQGIGSIGATYFQSTLNDEIFTTFPPPDFIATPANRDRTSKQHGVEAYANLRPGSQWRIDGAYTYLRARENDLPEVRRPSHIGSLAVTWLAPRNGGNITVVARYNGATDDVAFTNPSFIPVRVSLDDYLLVNANAEYALGDRVALFGRIDNLLAEDYEDVFSFTNPGRAAFVGIKARF